MNESLLNELSNVGWQMLYTRLNAYARIRIKKVPKWSRGKHLLPGGRQPEDFVDEAIMLLFEGTREWDRKKCPDLLKFLKGVISSLVSAAAESKENRTSTSDNTSDYAVNGFEQLKGNMVSPSDILLENELYCKFEALVKSKNDEDLLAVFIALSCGISKPQEISKETDIELKKVYNLLKKVRRMLLPLADEPITVE